MANSKYSLFDRLKTSHDLSQEERGPEIKASSKPRKTSGNEQSQDQHAITPQSKQSSKHIKSSAGEQGTEIHSTTKTLLRLKISTGEQNSEHHSSLSSPKSQKDSPRTEEQGIELHHSSSSKLSRKSDPRSKDSLDSPTRRSSPRTPLLKKLSADNKDKDSIENTSQDSPTRKTSSHTTLRKKLSADNKDKDSIENTSLDSPTRKTSSHTPLRKKLSKDQKDKDSVIEHNISEENHGIISYTTKELTPKIIPNDKLYSFSSSEQENETQAMYKLNLDDILSKRKDPTFYRRTRAYMEEALIIKIAPEHEEKPFKFLDKDKDSKGDYIKYITEELNAVQRNKYNIISALVKSLNKSYKMTKRTENNHIKFCKQLKKIVEYCMNTSPDACDRSKYYPQSSVSPAMKIERFWDTAFIVNLVQHGREEYYIELKKLISAFNRSFLMAEKLLYFTDLYNKQDDKTNNHLCCISSKQLYSTANLFIKDSDLLKDFKTSYNANCVGLAENVIYIPDIWYYVKRVMDNIDSKNNPYYDLLKQIDNMFLVVPVFKDFEPECKSKKFSMNLF